MRVSKVSILGGTVVPMIYLVMLLTWNRKLDPRYSNHPLEVLAIFNLHEHIFNTFVH